MKERDNGGHSIPLDESIVKKKHIQKKTNRGL
jgi:hypothetical protein